MNAVTVSPGNFSTPVYNPPLTAPGWPPSGGVAPARRGSGAESMASVLACLTLVNFIALYILNPYRPLFGDGALARFIMEFLFGGVWFIIVGLALCLRHRAAAGSAVALLFFVPHVATHAINVTQSESSVDGETEFALTVLIAMLIAILLFSAFIMNLSDGPRGAGAPSKPLQLSEAALAYCMVATIIDLFNGIHALMGYPLFGRGVVETDIPSMMMAVYACDVIALILGIGAIVVLRSRRSRGAYAGLLAGQAIFWAAAVALNYVWLVNDVYHRFYPVVMMPGIIVAIIVLVFALMAGAPSVGQWFAGVPAPVAGIPAPGVNVGGPVPVFGGPVMAAAPAPAAAPQRILGADGRMYTVMAAAPAPVMGGAPGFAGGAFAPAAAPAPFPQAAAPSAPVVPSAPAVPSGAAAPAPAPPSQSAAPAASSGAAPSAASSGAAPSAASSGAAPSAASSGAAPSAPPLVGYGSPSGPAPSSA